MGGVMKALKIIGKIVAVLIILALLVWGSVELGRWMIRNEGTQDEIESEETVPSELE